MSEYLLNHLNHRSSLSQQNPWLASLALMASDPQPACPGSMTK